MPVKKKIIESDSDGGKKPTKINKKKKKNVSESESSEDSDVSEVEINTSTSDSETNSNSNNDSDSEKELDNKPKDLLKILKQKSELKEWVPNVNDSLWKHYSENLQEYGGKLINIEYTITEDMIKKAKEIKTFEDLKQTNTSEYAILRVYKIYDKDEKVSMIAYCRNFIHNVLMTELYHHFVPNGRPTKFKTFIDQNIKLTDLKVVLLGMYKAESTVNVSAEMNKVKKSFDLCEDNEEKKSKVKKEKTSKK